MKASSLRLTDISCSICFWLLLTGCTAENSAKLEEHRHRYSFYVMMKDGTEYIAQTDTIGSGFLDPLTEGAMVSPLRIFYELIVKGQHYYMLDWKTGRFLSYQVRNDRFVRTDSLQLAGNWSVDNYRWVGDTLWIAGYDSYGGEVRYAEITADMRLQKEGTIDIPKPSGPYNSMSVGFSTLMNGALYLGYTYHTAAPNTYVTSDTMYVTQLALPGLAPLHTYKDSRSAYPGGINTRQSHFFTDEQGDFYFISCPGIALGNHPGKPTGIFRIRREGGMPDPDYFFNLSASSIRNHGYGLWYIGNGKAIARTERRELFKGMQDHYLVPHFDFYLLDLKKQTTVRLDLPLDKGTARNCVLAEDGLVYITLSPGEGGCAVWIYNPEDGSLRRGLRFSGEVDYILRLDRLDSR